MSNQNRRVAQETVVIPLQQVKERVGTAQNPLWKYLLAQRLESEIATDGVWIVNSDESTSCIAHVVKEMGREKIALFCRDPDTDTSPIIGLLRRIADLALTGKDVATIGFSGLDRRLVPMTRQFFQDHFQTEINYYTPCKMIVYGRDQQTPEFPLLPANVKIRPLMEDDAELVNARWEYRSDYSLAMIRQMIASKTCLTLGLEEDGQLVVWVCQYLDGPLGMLWTEKSHRRKGYAELLVVEAMKQRSDASQPWMSFVVDTNVASQSLLDKLHWEQVTDADWIGFTIRRRVAKL
jgi:ribosomal protein S18 acetylase RimI-like enzyme